MLQSLAIAGLFSLAPAQGEACTAGARLEGAPELLERVRAVLQARGLGPAPCGAMVVRVAQRGAALALEIERTPGEAAASLVRDPGEAATIIESWVREDLVAPLLLRAPPAAAPRPAAERERVAQPRPEAPARARRYLLSAGPVAGVGSDGSTWSGGELRGCAVLGPLCLGARLQYATDLRTTGDAARLGGARTMGELTVTADLPLSLGPFDLAPGLGVGQALTQSRRAISAGVVEEDAGGFHLRAQIGASWRWSAHWGMRLDLAADWAPWARRELRESLLEDAPGDVALAGEVPLAFWARLGPEVGDL